MSQGPNLSSYIVAEATPEEMVKQWRHVEVRLGGGPRRRRWPALSLALVGATAAIVAFVSLQRAAPERAWNSEGSPFSAALPDGSRVELRPRSQVTLLGEHKGEVRLRLSRGGARFEVRHQPGRRFQVTAAGVDVVVTGTAFSVELRGGQGVPRVSVERGEVEVHPLGEARLLARLHADEVWPPAPAPSLAPAPGLAPVAPAAPSAVEPRPQGASATSLAGAPIHGTPVRRAMPTDPRLLLEEANSARRNGDVERAAALLETLRVRHPRDPRAALATFELGRLRMDALGDPKGAIQALQQSIALAPAGVFREDAEACLATAYARMRDHQRCEHARQTYLGHYPAGTHAAEMSALVCREH